MALDPITAIAEGGGKLLDIIKRFIPDQEKAQEAAREIAQYSQAIALAQIELNKIEAASSNLFVSGWRPAVGWVCVAGYAYHYILQPFLVFLLVAFNVQFQADHLPQLNIMELSVMLANLLGFGAYRTYEKVKGNGK